MTENACHNCILNKSHVIFELNNFVSLEWRWWPLVSKLLLKCSPNKVVLPFYHLVQWFPTFFAFCILLEIRGVHRLPWTKLKFEICWLQKVISMPFYQSFIIHHILTLILWVQNSFYLDYGALKSTALVRFLPRCKWLLP